MKSNGQFYLKFLAFLTVILLVVIAVLLTMKQRISPNAPTVAPMPTSIGTSAFPYFSSDYSTVGKNNEWILRNFQPKLIDFESKNNSNYLIAEYTDGGNRKKQVKIFVTGQTPDGSYIDKTFLHYGDKQGEWLEFGELKKKLVKNNQIRIEYLTFNESTYDRASCQKYLNFCALASILEGQNLKGKLEERLVNGETDDLIVPGNVISRQLYEK